ncbi:hypothetical protein PAECIP112173_00305 [Paenibacillus sp. JJ-100]|nr:hypothetical protein PAECIP112173_00305 [Paenibacillus sp. JJ-100]
MLFSGLYVALKVKRLHLVRTSSVNKNKEVPEDIQHWSMPSTLANPAIGMQLNLILQYKIIETK